MGSVSDVNQVEATTIPTSASTATLTVSSSVGTLSVQVLAANPYRKGCYIYNNSSNTVYINFGATVSSSTAMVLPIATFATWAMPLPIYTGKIAAIRNSGTGTLLITELSA